MAAQVIERFADRFPAAMACHADDLEASLAHLRVPVRHRISVRTTNLIERSFEEERRRTKVIPRLLGERAAMKLVFTTLIRVSERWQRVAVSELERQQLHLLRRELGIRQRQRARGRRLSASRAWRDPGRRIYRRLRT
jgi:transposase-like protein